MDAELFNQAGALIGTVGIDEYIFGITPNVPVMHQMMVLQQANARQGTSNTLTRGQVRGSTRKIYRQKGTGRARQGAIRAPHHAGGGVVFGPHPRKYTQTMPKKMRRLAVRSALSAKQADGQLRFVDRLSIDRPKTKAVIEFLHNLRANDTKTLIVLSKKDENIIRSANNLPQVKTLLVNYLNVIDLLKYDLVVVPTDALAVIETWLGASNRTKKRSGITDDTYDETIDHVNELEGVQGQRTSSSLSAVASRTVSNPLAPSEIRNGRYVNTWFEGDGISQLSALGVGQRYDFMLQIIDPPHDLAPLAEADFGDLDHLNLGVSLLSKDFVIEEGFHRLVLPRKGGTKIIRTLVEPLHPGTCRLEIVIYLASKLEILQRLDVQVAAIEHVIGSVKD